MGTNLIGETFALLAALTWAFALVLFKLSGERVGPLALNLFKNTIGLIMLAVTLLFISDTLGILGHVPQEDIVILLFSGLIGIALADTVFFHALNLVGVTLVSIVDCLYSPFVILFSCLILSETLGLSGYVGTGLILAGVFISSRHAPPADRTPAQLILGSMLGASSMALMTFGIVIAKPVLELYDFPLILATTLRMAAGTAALALLAIASRKRGQYWSVFRPSPVWRVSIPASVLGTYFALIFWMAGFKYAKASIAGILNQTSVIFAINLATIILREPLTRRKLVSVVLAGAGVAIVTLRLF